MTDSPRSRSATFFLVFLAVAWGAALLPGHHERSAGHAQTTQATKPPFRYVWAKAYHVLPGTHSDESGYFSLSQGLDGMVHIGTAKYQQNAYLVSFDPSTESQRIIVDVNKACGLTARGYAAQAKIHTRNDVGASGKVYVGSKQGYRAKGDNSQYPGGYVMAWDPRTGATDNLGMPLAEQGIADVVADEARGHLYVVTCEDQHWLRYDLSKKKYAELGSMLTPYATTLVDSRGVASAITRDFKLTQFHPDTGEIITRDIIVDGQPFTRANQASIPTWRLAENGRSAFLILMNDPALLEIDLHAPGKRVPATNHGRMIEGEGFDSRCALSIAPDGRVYVLGRVNNDTGFGKGMLHYLLRFDPGTGKHEKLGVLAVKNKDFFNFAADAKGKKPPWSHGYHTLPDGTLTPLHNHMALLVARDHTLYATIIYPFTLLRIDGFKLEATPDPSPAERYVRAAIDAVDTTEASLPLITRVADLVADRHLKGGLIGFPWIGSTLEQEICGRSGGLMHVGFKRPWKTDRTEAEKKNDVAIFSWDRKPNPGDLKRIKQYRQQEVMVLGFGPRGMPELAEHVMACDHWIDTHTGKQDRVIQTADGRLVGKTNHLRNALNGWAFVAEVVAALTRRGKMPTMWKSWGYPDGKAWSDKLFRKKQFHDEYKIAPVAEGDLSRAFLRRMRSQIRQFGNTQLGSVRQAAKLIDAEAAEGRKTIVASSGHMAMNYVAKYDDGRWAVNNEVHHNVPSQMEA
ncbi:MAG: hypothetical protein OER86_13260, partial [Phycisphaerae bacterium]|nr:hypothetical protein [Phycisphaerae bacterium]